MTLRTFLTAVFSLLLLGSLAVAQGKTDPARAAILPDAFAGWTKSAGAQTGTDASKVDAAQSPVLQEYGFRDFEQATYTQNDRRMTVRAARFADASGAYGAFTFYREPKMQVEKIGTMAASANERVVFFRDNIVVQATLDRVTAMTASELRELAANLPSVNGPAAQLPTLPQYLPREQLVPNSAKYLLGEKALSASGLTFSLQPQVVEFGASPELMSAKVSIDQQQADLLLVSYPTPQIAIERLKAFEGANPQHQNVTYAVKRTGPIVAVVSGPISERDARNILGRINYEAEVTWNENTGLSKRDNIGNLVIAAVTLAGIIFMISVGTGAILGFWRGWARKLLPGRFAEKSDDADFIRLNIKD